MDIKYHLIAANLTGKIGLKTLQRLETKLGSLDALTKIDPATLARLGLVNEAVSRQLAHVYKTESFTSEIVLAQKNNIKILTILEPDYPEGLRNLSSPPLVLYIRGNLSFQRSCGIVGARNPNNYGMTNSYRFSKSLAESGVCIVSGLALGIDSVSHSAALSAKGGTTIAVAGSGLLNVYPIENRSLAEKIQNSGAFVSEYPLRSPALPVNFPMRNRIIAALSECILCVQAGVTSGSLITCDWALELGKDVYCIPGGINDPLSLGCNLLISSGAKLAISPEQILNEIWNITPLYDTLESVVLTQIKKSLSIRELIQLTGIKENTLKQILERLITKGCVQRDAKNRFSNRLSQKDV
ncbi:MAG: DNA-protecting protein DprA [Planctomycetes bacterium]|nr:DNA-protecting protein DprA [Planctomycetota bacterium]